MVGNTEFELCGSGNESNKLRQHRVIETEPFAKSFPLLHRGFDSDHLVDRVANKAKQQKGDQRDNKHHEDRLEQPSDHKGKHWNTGSFYERIPARKTCGRGQVLPDFNRCQFLVTLYIMNWLSARWDSLTLLDTPQASPC